MLTQSYAFVKFVKVKILTAIFRLLILFSLLSLHHTSLCLVLEWLKGIFII